MGRARRRKLTAVPALLKLDFGCGPHPRAGFEGVDRLPFDGVVTHVLDLAARTPPRDGSDVGALRPWPWTDHSVVEAYASHFIEHLTAPERVHFVNELYRVLVPGGTCQLIVPHWNSCRAYGDPTHQWPPVSEFWFYYLSRPWRTTNAPHTDVVCDPQAGFSCDFEAVWGYSLREDLLTKHPEAQQFAAMNYKEVCLDLIATLTKRMPSTSVSQESAARA